MGKTMNEITIIGFGELGRNLIKTLNTQKTKFDYILIDNHGNEEYLFKIDKQNTHSEYEESTKLLEFPRFNPNTKEVFVFTSGGLISGCISSLISYYKLANTDTKNINFKVWFIKPNFENLSEKKKLGCQTLFNGLSGLTKAGIFSDLFLFDNSDIESIPGLSIKDYLTAANQNILYFFQMNILLEKNLLNPVYTTYDSSLDEENMFHSFGMVDFQKSHLKHFGKLKGEHIQHLVAEIPASVLENEQENFSSASFKNLLTRIRTDDTVASYFDVVETENGEKNSQKTSYDKLDRQRIVMFVKSSSVVLQQI